LKSERPILNTSKDNARLNFINAKKRFETKRTYRKIKMKVFYEFEKLI